MSIRRFGELAQQWCVLEKTGIPLESLQNRVGIDARSSGPVLTIRTGDNHPWRTEIRELSDGRFGYILSVFVRRDLPGKTRIRDSWVSPPWDDVITWLEDPRDWTDHPGWYTLPSDTEQFARVEVLNHYFNGVLSYGNFREGLLLGVGAVRPPDTYKNYDQVPVIFSLVDQWDRKHSGKLLMEMNRYRVREKVYKRTTPRLFSRPPDVIAPRGSLIAPIIGKKDEEKVRRAFEEMIRVSSKRKHEKVLIGSETQ